MDAWAVTEQSRLRCIERNHDHLRADLYQELVDVIGAAQDGEIEMRNLGQHVILPSTHIESTRYMFQTYQDSMAITRFYKHPDIIGTITCNRN